MLVSVVMPAHNAAPHAEEAARSVLGQTYRKLELIVVDDGSTDGTEAQLAGLTDPRLTVVRQPNRGAAAARNAGLDRAMGEVIALIDADDRWHAPLLARMVDLLMEHSDVDLVFPAVRYIAASGEPLDIDSARAPRRYELVDLLVDNPIHSATGTVLRRRAAAAVGRFDENLRACIDLDYWLRVASLRPGNVLGTGEILADYRRHGDQITGDWRRMRDNWEKMLTKVAAASPGIVAPVEREARARQYVYWSALAYEGGDFRASRRLIGRAWLLAGPALVRSSHAWVRAAAALSSLLPARLHAGLRRSFERVRARLGLRIS